MIHLIHRTRVCVCRWCKLSVFNISGALNSRLGKRNVSDEDVVTFPGALCLPSSAASLAVTEEISLRQRHILQHLTSDFSVLLWNNLQTSTPKYAETPTSLARSSNEFFNIACRIFKNQHLPDLHYASLDAGTWLAVVPPSLCLATAFPSTQQLHVPHAVVILRLWGPSLQHPAW